MEYADLSIIDLSKGSTPEGRAELSIAARNAMRDVGFFYVINHGYTQEQVNICTDWRESGACLIIHSQNDRIFDIADVPFAQVGEDEKRKYEGKMLEAGSYQGYKLRNYWVCFLQLSLSPPLIHTKHIDNNIRDQVEAYSSKSFL